MIHTIWLIYIYKTNKSHHDHHQTLLFLLGYWFVTPLLVSMLVGQLSLVPPGGLCLPKVVLKWPGGNWPIICSVRHSQKTLLEWIVEYSRMLIQWQWRYQSLLLSKCSTLWTQDRVLHGKFNNYIFRCIYRYPYYPQKTQNKFLKINPFWLCPHGEICGSLAPSFFHSDFILWLCMLNQCQWFSIFVLSMSLNGRWLWSCHYRLFW